MTIHAQAARSPSRLIRGLAGGTIDPASVTDKEQAALRAHVGIALKRMRLRIRSARDAGRLRIAKREQRALLRNPAVRLFVAFMVDRKTLHRAGRSTLKKRSFESIWLAAQQLLQPSATSTAFQFLEKKARGGYRVLHQFDELGVAKQWLALCALKPFASYRPSRFVLKRGQSVACEELLKAMDHASEGTRFIQFDVRDFFGSISHEWLRENLPLSSEIIRRVVLISGYRILKMDNGPARYSANTPPHGRRIRASSEVNIEMGQRGIPQGSAVSPIVAEIVMSNVLRSVADLLEGLTVFVHSDNIGILVPPHMDAAVLEKDLADAFDKHPAGPFHLTTSGPSSLENAFRFLGYHFEKLPGQSARAYIPDHIWEGREAVYLADIVNAETAREISKVAERVSGYRAAFKLWAGAIDMEARVLGAVQSELTRRHRGRAD